MAKPRVSIIVPVYNIEKYIGQCIESILRQTYKNFELLLVDDGSTDSSGRICDDYSAVNSQIKTIHKPNGGLTSARNAGLEHAQGEWICHIDGDDWVMHDYLEKMISKAEDKQADITICDMLFIFPDRAERMKMYDWDMQGIYGLGRYISTVWTTLCGSIQKRRLYIEYNFKSPQKVNYCEDFHLITRLISVSSRVAKVKEPLYCYRQQASSIVHNMNHKTMRDEIWVYTDTIEYFKSIGIYEALKEPMAWRTLKATQDLVLDATTFDEFRAINPQKRDYIWNCPFINRKLKLMMWCLTHGLTPVTRAITLSRKLLNR